jgi:outer membrane protein TolC
VARFIAGGLVLFIASLTLADAAPLALRGPVTLAQVVDRVREAGFDVRMALADAAMASADAATSRAGLLPQISVSGTATGANIPQLGMPIARQVYGSANISVPLLAGSGVNAARAARASSQASLQSVNATRADAVFAAVQAYRRAQLASAVLDARDAAVLDQQTHLHLTEAKVQEGKSPSYLAARDRAALASALQMEEDAAAERDEALNDLGALLDVGPDAQLAIAESLSPIAFSVAREVILARALAQNPLVEASRDRMISAQRSVIAAQAAFYPTATLSAQSYNGTSNPYLGGAGGQVGITVNLPVFDGGAHAAALAHARAGYDRAAADYDRTRANVQRDLSDAWRELQAAQRNMSTAATAQVDANEQLRVARLRESAGKAIELEVLDALAVAASARETALRAIARYDVAVAAVHHAAGDQTT